jgi:hypothetical protein
MKITESQIRKIIKEEILKEMGYRNRYGGSVYRPDDTEYDIDYGRYDDYDDRGAGDEGWVTLVKGGQTRELDSFGERDEIDRLLSMGWRRV